MVYRLMSVTFFLLIIECRLSFLISMMLEWTPYILLWNHLFQFCLVLVSMVISPKYSGTWYKGICTRDCDQLGCECRGWQWRPGSGRQRGQLWDSQHQRETSPCCKTRTVFIFACFSLSPPAGHKYELAASQYLSYFTVDRFFSLNTEAVNSPRLICMI